MTLSTDDKLERFTESMKLRAKARDELRSNTSAYQQMQQQDSAASSTAATSEPARLLLSTLHLGLYERHRRSLTSAFPSLTHPSDSSNDESAIVKDLAEELRFNEEIGHIAVKPDNKLHQLVNTDVFPFYPAGKTLTTREYWLAAAVIDCADYDKTAAMLESGAIQYALNTCREDATHEVLMLLVTLLRLAASCYTHAHFLLSSQKDIFNLLFDCMKVNRLRPASMDSVARWNQISDSRAYSSFLVIAFGAHTRPTAVRPELMTSEEEWAYKKHVQIIWDRFERVFQNPHTYARNLPEYLTPYVETFYLSDIAVEIFIDLAPHGFFDAFAGHIVEVKWDRCFNNYVENAPFNINTVKLFRLLHQSPRTVAAHLERPFAIYRECYSYLSWGLRAILDNDFYRNPTSLASMSRPRVHVPLTFCTCCAETLRSFLDFPALGASTSFRDVRAFLRRQSVIDELLRFVLAMPDVVKAKQDKDLDLLYAAVWSIIHSTSHTFPFMFRLLVEFARDETVPDCLGLQSAMYVATCVSFARVRLKRSEVLGVYGRLLHCYKNGKNEPPLVKRRRQELLLRMAVILCPNYFQSHRTSKRSGWQSLSDETAYANLDTSSMISTSEIFTPYSFAPEDQPTTSTSKFQVS